MIEDAEARLAEWTAALPDVDAALIWQPRSASPDRRAPAAIHPEAPPVADQRGRWGAATGYRRKAAARFDDQGCCLRSQHGPELAIAFASRAAGRRRFASCGRCRRASGSPRERSRHDGGLVAGVVRSQQREAAALALTSWPLRSTGGSAAMVVRGRRRAPSACNRRRLASARWLAADLVDPGQADRSVGRRALRAFRNHGRRRNDARPVAIDDRRCDTCVSRS